MTSRAREPVAAPRRGWFLRFATSTPPSLDELSRVLGARFGATQLDSSDDWAGDPRDGYCRGITLTVEPPGLRVHMVQEALSKEDPAVPTGHLSVELAASGSFAEHHALWTRIGEVLAPLGYVDRTLESDSARIVDEAEREDPTLAVALRARTTAALVGVARRSGAVTLASVRPDDLNAVLRAWRCPLDIRTISFNDCRLTELPSELARFPNVRSLSLAEPELPPEALVGWTFPGLEELALLVPTPRLPLEALRGCPRLEWLSLSGALEDLDEALTQRCPELKRLSIQQTPLARNARRCGELAARWPGVRVEHLN